MKWPKRIESAIKLQNELRDRVRIIPLDKKPSCIAGVDAAFTGDKVVAAISLFSYPGLELLEEQSSVETASFPYVPGLLAFREGPAIFSVLKKLKRTPELLLMDGQGIAHPRRIGIASHLGIILDIITIGCAKSRLVGKYAEPGLNRGDWSPLHYKDEIVGAVLRTRSGVKPLFISPGNNINITDAIGIVLDCATKYRIPEPLRRADMLSKRIKRNLSHDQ